MKVRAVRTFLVDPGSHKPWLFVRLETDTGLVGWGECYTQPDRERAIEAHVQELARYLTGRSPFDIKAFTYLAYTDFAGKRGAMDLYCAISGLEQALWDVVGKAAGQPVYNLLGGAFRASLRVYANGWATARDPEGVAEQARATVARGFDALKFDPFPGPWRAYIDRRDEERAVEQVKAVRQAVGPRVDIMVEVHRRLAPMHAIRVARSLEPHTPFWYEEPVSARDLGGLVEAKRAINLPVVTGEELYTKTEFQEVMARRAADILNPDVCNCGGILELREIAAMAEAHHIAIAPHNYNSTTIGLAATLQASAAMPNFIITEYFVNFEEVGRAIARPPFRVDGGRIALPTAPGLGLELDEDALVRHPHRPRPLRAWRPASAE
jgi:galactonate dehydratase